MRCPSISRIVAGYQYVSWVQFASTLSPTFQFTPTSSWRHRHLVYSATGNKSGLECACQEMDYLIPQKGDGQVYLRANIAGANAEECC